MDVSQPSASSAIDGYLLLADISGYTAFVAGVGETHGVDFSAGIPAGYGLIGELLDTVVEGVQPDFGIAMLGIEEIRHEDGALIRLERK